tara:strand:+ start:191 stop:679 length:489 start_codon:yes stop_codon:yes gene_type:complete
VILIWSALIAGCLTTESQPPGVAGIDQPAFTGADTDANGKLSQSELAKLLHKEALAEFDLNDDNLISADEWASVKPSAIENDELFSRLDKNNDSEIDEVEAMRFITEHDKFGDSFKTLDQNGDAHLHWEELSEADPAAVDFTLLSPKEKSKAEHSEEKPDVE